MNKEVVRALAEAIYGKNSIALKYEDLRDDVKEVYEKEAERLLLALENRGYVIGSDEGLPD